MCIQSPIGDLFRGIHNSHSQTLIQQTLFHIRQGSSLLNNTQRMNQRQRHGFRPDPEILQAALCLGTPVFRAWHINTAKGI